MPQFRSQSPNSNSYQYCYFRTDFTVCTRQCYSSNSPSTRAFYFPYARFTTSASTVFRRSPFSEFHGSSTCMTQCLQRCQLSPWYCPSAWSASSLALQNQCPCLPLYTKLIGSTTERTSCWVLVVGLCWQLGKQWLSCLLRCTASGRSTTMDKPTACPGMSMRH